MRRRVNITLPEETIRMLDRVAAKGERSRLIDEAVRDFVKVRHRETLRTRLKEGARKRAERDLRLAEDGFSWKKNHGGPAQSSLPEKWPGVSGEL